MLFFFLMIRRPPRSTLDRSSAASDVYKRQNQDVSYTLNWDELRALSAEGVTIASHTHNHPIMTVSYTHLRAHETVLDLVCRLLLEKKKRQTLSTSFD